MSDDLLIKISADVKDVKQAYADVKAQTEDLDESLAKVAKVSAVAFAALSAQVGIALHEFAAAEQSSRELTNALQNQGIYTTALKNTYKEYADQIEKATGIQADEITKAQAVAQSFLGQIPITEKLTAAIADLAAKEGISLPAAAAELGKAIGNGTGQLLRQGLQFASTDTAAQRYEKTLEFVTVKAGGMAEETNKGLGSIRGLETAFKNAQQELGQRFAPAAELVIKALTNFLTPAKDSTGALVDLKAILIVTGLAVSGLGIALPLLSQALLTVRAAALAFNITLNATRIALAGLGIGLIIVLLTELVIHWEAISGRIKQVVKGMVEVVSGAFAGLATVIQGALMFDKGRIQAGITEIQNAFKEGVATAGAEIPKATEKALQEQDDLKKKYADKQAALKAEQDATRLQLQKAQDDAIMLELTNASEAQIALKKQEIETLKALEQNRNADQIALLKQRLEQIRKEEDAQREEDKERDAVFREEELIVREEHGNSKVQITTAAEKKEIAVIKASQDTEKTAQKKVYEEDLKESVKRHNTFLQEQIKYGVAYATINKAMHSNEVQGLKQATGELTQLTQSKNSTLKEIGKVATIAQIVIKTAESAMNIYAGFSAIPIIGPILGIAGAAAAVAFGAEQVRNVSAAQQGALVQGVGYGDKVPFMLEPGELVTPRQNFEEVVQGVAQQRGYTTEESEGKSQNVAVMIGFDGREAQQVLTARRSEDRALGTYRSNS